MKRKNSTYFFAVQPTANLLWEPPLDAGRLGGEKARTYDGPVLFAHGGKETIGNERLILPQPG